MPISRFVFALSIFAFMHCSSVSYSQLIIKGEDGSVISETMIDIYLESDVEFYTYQATTINNYDSALTLNAKRIELSYIPNTYEIFDWNCGLPPIEAGTEEVFYSPSAFELEFEAGDSLFPGLPTFMFWPYENVGDAVYRYVVYDVNNPDDSTWVDVHYYIGTLNVEEDNKPDLSAIYPNPAHNYINVYLNHNIENPHFDIISMVGTRIEAEQVRNVNGKITIDISSLPPGVYLLQEIESQITQKFIISR